VKGSLQWILAMLPRYGGRRALGLRGEYGTRWWTYMDLYRHSLRAAQLFSQRGLLPGDRVLLWGENAPEWVACLLGAALRGLVIVPIDAKAEKNEVQETAARTGARLLLAGERRPLVGVGIHTVAMNALDRVMPGELELLRTPVTEQNSAVILFTAGSSGEPRGVILNHGNLASQVAHFSYWTGLLRAIPTRLLALSPLSHVQGLMLSACVPLSLGLSVLYSHSIEPEHLERTLREGKVRVLSTVPRVLATLQASLTAKSHETGHRAGWTLRRKLLGRRFRVVLVGGATLPKTQEDFWRGLGCVVVQGYGSTETTAFVSVNRPLIGRRGSVGKMVHRGSVRLAADGEILVRGPHLSPGYFGTRASLDQSPDGYLRTGDLGEVDKRGRLFFLGRREDRIVTAEGHTLHPNGIETVLREIEGVDDIIVMPVMQDGLEHVHAVLVMDPSMAATAILEANRRLPEAARIRSWTVWPDTDFPCGALGKPKRTEIMQQVQAALKQGESLSSRRRFPLEDTLATAMEEPDRPHRLQRVRRVLIQQQDSPRTFNGLLELLRPLGMDSIDVAELTTLLRRDAPASVVPPNPPPDPPAPPPRSGAPLRNPVWQMWPGAGALRLLGQAAFLKTARRWVHAQAGGATLPVDGRPLLFAVSVHDRQHILEFVAILFTLPQCYRRRVIVTIGDAHIFESHFYRRPGDTFLRKWTAGFMAEFGVPSVLPYILSPGDTVMALMENCRAIEAGFSPLMTWDLLSATVACETGIPVVPVRMTGRRADWSADMQIEFGEPVAPRPGFTAAEFEQGVRQKLSAMGAQSRTWP